MKTIWVSNFRQGLAAGLIGFATVAVVFAVMNIASGQSPLFTVNLLGNALLGNVPEEALPAIAVVPVLAYTALHLVVFVVFGIVASILAGIADRGWQLWYIWLFSMLFVAFHMLGATQLFAAPLRALLPDGMIWAAGIVASLAMAGFLLRMHPGMRAVQRW